METHKITLKQRENPISYKCIFVLCTIWERMLYNIVDTHIWKQQHFKFMDHILEWSKKREKHKHKTGQRSETIQKI